MLVLNLLAFESNNYAAYDRFHGNGPYGEIPTKKGPIRTLGLPSRIRNLGRVSERSELWGLSLGCFSFVVCVNNNFIDVCGVGTSIP